MQSVQSDNDENEPLLTRKNQLSTLRHFLLFFALYFGVFLAALDSTVVSTLLSHIASDLKELDNISWVASAYLIAYSALQPLYGKLSDIFGRKVVLLACIFLFGLGCLFCGSGSTISPLIAGRFISGIGAGGMLSISTITASDYVSLRKRGIYQGIGNISFGAGASLGGVLGAWFTEFNGWRSAFLVQVPLAALCFGIVVALVQNKKAEPMDIVEEDHADHVVYRNSFERIDFVGAFALTASLVSLMLAVTTGGNQMPWFSLGILGCLVLFLLFGALFVYWEKYKAVEPVVPLDLVLKRNVISSYGTNFFCSGVVYGTLYYFPVLLVALFNYSYTVIGHRMIAQFVGVAVGSMGSGIIMRRTGRYYMLGALSTVGIFATLLMNISTPYVSAGSSAIYQSVAYALNGISYSVMLTVSLVSLISSVKHSEQAIITSSQYTFRGAGSSIGVAFAAAIFQNVLGSQLHKRVHGKHAAEVIRKVSKSVDAIRLVPEEYQSAVIASYKVAGVSVLVGFMGWSLLATLSQLLGKEYSLDRAHPYDLNVSVSDEPGTDSDGLGQTYEQNQVPAE